MITLYKYRPFNDHLRPVIVSEKIWFPARARLKDPEDLELNLFDDVDPKVYREFLITMVKQKGLSQNQLKQSRRAAFTARGKLKPEALQKIAGP